MHRFIVLPGRMQVGRDLRHRQIRVGTHHLRALQIVDWSGYQDCAGSTLNGFFSVLRIREKADLVGKRFRERRDV